VPIDERLKYRQLVAQAPVPSGEHQDDSQRLLNQSGLTAAVELSIKDRSLPKNPQGPPTPATTTAPVVQPGRVAPSIRPDVPAGESAGSFVSLDTAETAEKPSVPVSPGRSDDSFDDPPLAEELPAVGPPLSVICPASMSNADQCSKESRIPTRALQRPTRGGLSRERPVAGSSANSMQMVRLCGPCAGFFEVGVGETYAMLQRKEGVHSAG